MNVDRIAKELTLGNLVIAPTDTVYGILADALNLQAVRKVFACKRRDENKPLLVVVSDYKMLSKYVCELSDLEKELIQKYCPGPLTLLLRKNDKISDVVTGGSEWVGVRIPKNTDLVKVIEKVGRPLISTSANLAGEDTIIDPAEIDPELLQRVAYVENMGMRIARPSAILKIVNEAITILRIARPSAILKIVNEAITILRYGDIVDRIMVDYPSAVKSDGSKG